MPPRYIAKHRTASRTPPSEEARKQARQNLFLLSAERTVLPAPPMRVQHTGGARKRPFAPDNCSVRSQQKEAMMRQSLSQVLPVSGARRLSSAGIGGIAAPAAGASAIAWRFPASYGEAIMGVSVWRQRPTQAPLRERVASWRARNWRRAILAWFVLTLAIMAVAAEPAAAFQGAAQFRARRAGRAADRRRDHRGRRSGPARRPPVGPGGPVAGRPEGPGHRHGGGGAHRRHRGPRHPGPRRPGSPR